MSVRGQKLLRADLVQKLGEKGFSRRLAAEMVNLLFAAIAEALIRGEEVKFPFGHLERVERKRKPQRGWFLGKIMTTYKNPWTVELKVNDEGRKLLDAEDRRRKEAQRPPSWNRGR